MSESTISHSNYNIFKIRVYEIEKFYGIYVITSEIQNLQFRLNKKGIALLNNLKQCHDINKKKSLFFNRLFLSFSFKKETRS